MHQIENYLWSIEPFLNKIFSFLKEIKIDVNDFELDHICYRVETNDKYQELKESLNNFWELLSETEIGWRLISTFKLSQPILYNDRKIYLIELPSPKDWSFYKEWFEHAEFVINENLNSFVEKYPNIKFDLKAISKKINPDVSLKHENFWIKFHKNSLEYVIKYLQG